MLIVSKFHDFYDTASAHGVDKTCVYKRSKLEVEIKRQNWDQPYHLKLPNGSNFYIDRIHESRSSYTGKNVGRVDVFPRVIAFCGNFYPVIKIKQTDVVGKPFCAYSAEEFAEFVAREDLFSNRSRYRYFSPRWDRFNVEYEQGVKAFFDTSQMDRYRELFHAFKSPIISIGSEKKLIVNPNLKDYGFMKVKDPQSAFQDIYMYLSGVIGAPLPPKEKMSDKVLAAAKGHDGEYSFKKPPGKRGKNKWR